ncbi:MAG: hypothetical protein ACLPX5_06790 [Dissulfurispiraceae bacterium]
MKVNIRLSLKTKSPEEAQKILREVFEELVLNGTADSFGFEIQTDAGGLITHK